MNFRRYISWISLPFLVLCVAVAGCTSSDNRSPITNSSVINAYPDLYEGVFNRNAQTLLQFTTDSSAEVRQQAWRALAQTPIDSLPDFISQVKQSGALQAWFALSMHELSELQLRNLEKYWSSHPEEGAGVSIVLGRQGDGQTLSFLIDHVPNITGAEYEDESALAISRLMIRNQPDANQQLTTINAAFSSEDADIVRRWLYGLYRGSDEILNDTVQDSLIQQWKQYGVGRSANVDQYVAGIIGSSVFDDIMNAYQSQDNFHKQVQLGIELAQLTDEVDLSSSGTDHLKALMFHPNPHVAQQTLAGLSGRLASGDSLSIFIRSELIEEDQTAPFVWLQALNTVAEVDSTVVTDYSERLRQIGNSHPYLYPQVLQAWMKSESSEAVLLRLENTVGQGDPLKSMYALNALQTVWAESEQNREQRNRVRELTFEALALQDRGVTYSSQALLQDSLLFNQNDFPRINRTLNTFSLPGDIEVYQTFGALYKQRFEEQARPVIDSLAALGYVPLNRSLQQAGWDVQVAEGADQEFRTPNWNHLWELGKQPVWALETEKGTIKVEMNTQTAPATVSAIDSLTRAGAYDGVPFHRVVPNFVIQGGDIERQDGFGGPEFTLPTEASEFGYKRGAAGIASAGPDTEGSQYFFMHQWKPHLNGNYTLFGNIVEGLEIVDQIVVGDMVKKAYWEN